MPIRIYGTDLVFDSVEDHAAHFYPNSIRIEVGNMGGAVDEIKWHNVSIANPSGSAKIWGVFNPEAFQWFREQVPLGIFRPTFRRPAINEAPIKKWDNSDDYFWYLCYIAESMGYKPFEDKFIKPQQSFYFQFSETEKAFLIKLRLLGMPNRLQK